MVKIRHFEREWVFQPAVTVPAELQTLLPNADLVMQTLIRRGISDLAEILRYIDHTRYAPASPFDLPDMEKGVERILRAIQKSEKIGVWGDFDVDGQTSTAILVSTLRELGAECTYHIPVRGPETHGIGMNALRDFLAEGVQVILTCDTGITAHESIDYAQSHGIDIVVTDHHLLPETLPAAYAVINSRRLHAAHPLAALPGAGVAYKFAEALLTRSGRQEFASQLHDLTALGIIADLAELYGDTRYLVQSGLNRMRVSPRQAVAAMLNFAEGDPQNLTEEQVSFIIAPRLNAVGRLADANPMVEFLLSRNPSEIAVRFNQVEGLNSKRKLLCDQVFGGAQSLIEQNPAVLDRAVLVLHHPDWPAGVVGIVASRLVELYHRPVILLTGKPGETLRGSARSVEGVDITAAIRSNERFLLGFGGHPMAAGLSLDAVNLPSLIRGLDAHVRIVFSSSEKVGTLYIDQILSPSAISLDLARSLDLLAPYGPSNPPIVFCAEGMQIIKSRSIGKLSEHLLIDVVNPLGDANRFIWWNGSGLPLPEGRFDLAYSARASNYRGEDQVSLEWIDYRQREDEIDLQRENVKPTLVNVDLRRSTSPLEEIRSIAASPDTLVWAEGSNLPETPRVDRLALRPCLNLVIWSVPPNRELLIALLGHTKPEKVYWCLVTPPEHQLRSFLPRLAGLVKTTLTTGHTELDLSILASSVAVAESTVALALRWLAARGDITLHQPTNNRITAELDGSVNLAQQKKLEKALSSVFNELQAFTHYLRQTDLDQLTANLR
jgi:single-stranded-DNA-specific exonuclease